MRDYARHRRPSNELGTAATTARQRPTRWTWRIWPGWTRHDVCRRPDGPAPKLFKHFDKDSDGKLSKDEYKAAREFLKKERESGGGRRPFGGPRGGDGEAVKPGPHVDPADVKTYPDAHLFDPAVFR